MLWALNYLLWAAVLLGIPIALAFAWYGRGIAFIRTTAAILAFAFICMIVPYFVTEHSHEEGYALMGLLIIGFWSFAAGVVTAVCGAVLLWLRGGSAGAAPELRPEEEAS